MTFHSMPWPDWEKAKAAGAIFYADPYSLTDAMIDPLLREAVRLINDSGWVWTAESCQGHPDATELGAWTHNTRPMLRLVTRRENHGAMLDYLTQATNPRVWVGDDRDVGSTFTPGIELWPHHLDEHWAETLVYITARVAYERDIGCRLFERFARLLYFGPKFVLEVLP